MLRSLGHFLHWAKQNLEALFSRFPEPQENPCLQGGGTVSPIWLPKQITKPPTKAVDGLCPARR